MGVCDTVAQCYRGRGGPGLCSNPGRGRGGEAREAEVSRAGCQAEKAFVLEG